MSMVERARGRVRMRGRPPAVPAAAVVDEVRDLIATAAGAPCPTLDSLAAALGVNRDVAERALEILRDAGELQVRRSRAVRNRGGFKRQMRVKVDGQWMGWTLLSRRERCAVVREPEPDHIAVATAQGGFGSRSWR